MANTIQDKLAYLEETKGLIKQAIVAKGVSVSDEDTFRSYANKIEAIQSGGGGGTGSLVTGTKLGYSTFSTIPDEYISYLEQQTVMGSMFCYCLNLTTLSLFDTSKCTNMDSMFDGCEKLTTVPAFDTRNVTNMSMMFGYCKNLTTVPLFDTSKCINMNSMFESCGNLTTVPAFDTSSVTAMSGMFDDCGKLTTVPAFDTRNVTSMNSMFYYCNSLTTVPQFDTSNVTSMRHMFYRCSSLTNLGGFTGLKLSLDLSSSSKLTIDSVVNVINNAADMTSEPKTLTLHHDVFNKLSQEQIATASAKGWNIAAA